MNLMEMVHMNRIYQFFRHNHVLAVCEDAIYKESFTLNLSRFEMLDVPDLVAKCPILLKLFLNNNYLTKLPSIIANLSSLQVLTLDYNRLDAFPLVICQLTNLHTLNLSCNKISKLPREIGHLTQLKVFWCNNTGLLEIPEEIGNCQRLETFGVRGNKLKSIPNSIGMLTNLRWLTFETNELTDVPSTFGALSNLVHLNFRSNLLTTVPACLRHMSKLQYVFLNVNRIETLPTEEDLFGTRFVRMLNLSANPLINSEEFRQQLMVHMHLYCDELLEDGEEQHPAPHNGEQDNEDEGDMNSDWENSIATSDLDSTDESGPENDFEDISMLIPELSRYITNFT